jgi:hypothetical protein
MTVVEESAHTSTTAGAVEIASERGLPHARRRPPLRARARRTAHEGRHGGLPRSRCRRLVGLTAFFALLLGGAAQADAACRAPRGARTVAHAGGARVWRQTVRTPAAMRAQTARRRYPRYSGCVPGHPAHVLFRDYFGDPTAVRIAGRYAGLRDFGIRVRGGVSGRQVLYLFDLSTGRASSTSSFTPSVQDNGGSEAYEPGPLISWRVTSNGWLVYLDNLSDGQGFGVLLDAFSRAGATTLDLTRPGGITRIKVKGSAVSWRSSFSGARRVRLSGALLPGRPPHPPPRACALPAARARARPARPARGDEAAAAGSADGLRPAGAAWDPPKQLRLCRRSGPQPDGRSRRAGRNPRGSAPAEERDPERPARRQRARPAGLRRRPQLEGRPGSATASGGGPAAVRRRHRSRPDDELRSRGAADRSCGARDRTRAAPRSAGDDLRRVQLLKRRGRDSNPRDRSTRPNGFQDRRIQPLCHPSGAL